MKLAFLTFAFFLFMVTYSYGSALYSPAQVPQRTSYHQGGITGQNLTPIEHEDMAEVEIIFTQPFREEEEDELRLSKPQSLKKVSQSALLDR